MEEMKCIHAKKERSEEEFKDLIHRLNRIEGQVEGLKGWWRTRRIVRIF